MHDLRTPLVIGVAVALVHVFHPRVVDAGPTVLDPGPGDSYAETVATIERGRLRLADAYREAPDADARAAVVELARETALRAVVDVLIPAWFGTPWDFNGVTQEPHAGGIACGVFVTSVLEDAGFRVERIPLGIQASEHIIQTLVDEDRIARHRLRTGREVADSVAATGDGLYVVGLDFHAGFLVARDGEVRFCHSSYLQPPEVSCQRAATAPAFYSDYRVVGHLLDDPMIEAWLTGRKFETVGDVGR